ncbi:DNA polymerase III subunit delta, partial [Leptolyngbya sp. FACHB-36]|uniref:DNA polymerase III subunit delta n=1 Tax=Leptolyngbya sp. FACHB-36 TaxID=2692808 RepID=UPI00167FE42D|nr:DNA polymerase III subunit delta [Leptolyngbya sp. FACHB-36]
MPVYVFWGDDDFAMAQAVEALRQAAIDPDWSSFNVDKLPSEQPDAVMQALNQVMTPPFGAGKRFVWLVDTPLLQRCPENVLAELERTLPAIPEASVLLLTSPTKPDGRLKSTKLLQKYAEVREFSQISPWKTDLLVKQVRQVAQAIGVRLTPEAVDLLVESVGNNTRQLYTELEKLRLYADGSKPLDATIVATLVTATNQNALQLGTAVRQGQVAEALDLVADLLRQNEPALRIVNSLVTQFRTWIWVKVMTESGERNEQAIAQAAELKNPKRLYYLQQEVRTLSLPTLLGTLPILLDLEA